MISRAAPSGSAAGSLDQSAALLLTLLCAIWGFNQVAIKIAMDGASPLFQSAVRSVGATALVLMWIRWRGIALFERDRTLGPGIVAGLLFAIEFLLIYWGLTYTTASRGILFVYSTPFFVAIGAHFFLPGDRLTRQKALGLAFAFVGLATAFGEGLTLPSGNEIVGDIMCLVGAVAWAATTLVIKGSTLAHATPEKTLVYQLAVSAVFLSVASAIAGEAGLFAPSAIVIGALGYQIVVVAAASYLAWFWLVARYPASRLAAFSFLTPVFGVVFGWLVLGEPLGPGLVAAAVLIALGIYMVNRPESRVR